jgi:hypothetical protein
MVITLKVAAWVFVIAGIISGFSIYPSDPLAPGFTLDSYTAARLAAPSLKALAVQVALSGLVAGLFTGAFACMLEVLEQIRDRMK